MANETIEDIVRDVRHVSELHGMSYMDDKNWHLTIHNYTRILADRIESAHDALTAENARLKAENDMMREALMKIENSAYGNAGCLRFPCPHFDDEVTCKHCEYCSTTIAREALAAEGGAK